MNFTCVIQARTTSTRLPNKVLADIEGKPMLQRVIDRVKASNVDEVILAIPDTPQNDVLDRFGGLPTYRGSEYDVLDRYCGAARQFNLKRVVRVTSDCPLLEPTIINALLEVYGYSPHDYFSFTGLPNGISAEVFSVKALREAGRTATLPYEREHVTPFLYSEQCEARAWRREKIGPFSRPDIRLSVDTPEDLELVRAVYKHFSPRELFSTEEVIAFLDSHPEIKAINAHVKQKRLGE